MMSLLQKIQKLIALVENQYGRQVCSASLPPAFFALLGKPSKVKLGKGVQVSEHNVNSNAIGLRLKSENRDGMFNADFIKYSDGGSTMQWYDPQFKETQEKDKTVHHVLVWIQDAWIGAELNDVMCTLAKATTDNLRLVINGVPTRMANTATTIKPLDCAHGYGWHLSDMIARTVLIFDSGIDASAVDGVRSTRLNHTPELFNRLQSMLASENTSLRDSFKQIAGWELASDYIRFRSVSLVGNSEGDEMHIGAFVLSVYLFGKFKYRVNTPKSLTKLDGNQRLAYVRENSQVMVKGVDEAERVLLLLEAAVSELMTEVAFDIGNVIGVNA